MKSMQAFFLEMKSKRIAFIGVGISNLGLIRQFAAKGLDVTVLDKAAPEEFGPLARELEALGVKLVLGSSYLDSLKEYDVILRSPGMYYHHPALEAARKAGCAVTSEMELFFDFCPCPLITVTGSDGKTTTTTLISEMLRTQGFTTRLGGNIGKALLVDIEQIHSSDWAVVELSSFQLISIRKSPDICVITNVTPNHLDVHKSMDEYIDAKRNIYRHQNAFGRAVLNADNSTTLSMADEIRGSLRLFSRRHPVEEGAFLDDGGYLCMSEKGQVTKILHKDEIRLPGIHNVENFLAAISAVWGIAGPEAICKVAREFGGVEHRIEFVRELDGVKYYNDSIASSPTRTIAGLNSFDRKIIIIAGGYDKKIPYEPLAPKIIESVKTLVLMGATAPKIEAAVRACAGFEESGLEILHAEDMEDAVFQARNAAAAGDIISLSPASASFDKYKNFEIRGQHFKEIVNRL